MRAQPITLSLGAQEWRIRPLTLKQVQEIEPLLLAEDRGGGSIATAIAIVAVALSRDHSEAAQSLDAVEASAQEIGAAMGAVLRLGGFVMASDAQQASGQGLEQASGQELGKAEAGADAISASSTPA